MSGRPNADVVAVSPKIMGEHVPEAVVVPNGEVMAGLAAGATTSGAATAEDVSICGVRIGDAVVVDTIERVDGTGEATGATVLFAPATGHIVMLPNAVGWLRPPRLG